VKLFLDTANLDEIKEIKRWGVLGGITTNPSLLSKEGRPWEQQMRDILDLVEGPVSLETTHTEADDILEEGLKLSAMGSNAVVKVAMTPNGLAAGKRLVDEGIRINVTLVFSPAQAILAAEIGAYIVSPFIGRIDDVASDGMHALGQICEIYEKQGYETQVLAASLRHPMHVVEAGLAGAHIATLPFEVFEKLVKHPLTDLGLEKFLSDWRRLVEGTQEGRSVS
jgi:transaldolase